MTIRIRILQLLLLLLVLVTQLPTVQVQLADAYYSDADARATQAQCQPETYWVVCDGSCGEGSRVDPFCSISSALDAAEDSAACGAVVNVANSWCPEDLSIRGDTTIVGQGSLTTIAGAITNYTDATLRLQDLAVFGTGDRATVSIDNAQAVTELDSVTIESGAGYGLRQRGGSLLASSLIVVDTTPQSTEDPSGAAISLEGGVRATLDKIQLYDSSVTGLLVTGDTTWANLGSVVIDDTVQALRVPGFVSNREPAGVAVRDGGLMTTGWLGTAGR